VLVVKWNRLPESLGSWFNIGSDVLGDFVFILPKVIE